MKKYFILSIAAVYSFGGFLGFGGKSKCICKTPESCTEVIANLGAVKKTLEFSYDLLDRLMAKSMNEVKKNESDIFRANQRIANLTEQIMKLQRAIAFEDKKKEFLLNKLKEMNMYKEIK